MSTIFTEWCAGHPLRHHLELRRLNECVKRFDEEVAPLGRQMPACQRLMTIPGIGVMTATALVAAVGDASVFPQRPGMVAWLGLVPRQRSTGGRLTLLGVIKRGDRYLRTSLIHGARSAMRVAPGRMDWRSRWALAVEDAGIYGSSSCASEVAGWQTGRTDTPRT